MALTNPAQQTPTVIDDDISRTVDNILKACTTNTPPTIAINDNDNSDGEEKAMSPAEPLPTDVYTRLLDSLSVAMQIERNGWKEKLHTTLQEIDRQHRASIAVQSNLQELVDSFGIVPLQSPKSDSSNGRRSADLISGLQTYIEDLQDTVQKATRDNQLELKLKKMQASVSQLEKEKAEHTTTIREKTKEIHWLQKELNAIRNQLQKLRRIVLNYNESHSSKFHLDDVEIPRDLETAQRGATVSRERTYVEGDQLDYFATPGEEIAVWKLRAKNSVTDSRKGSVRTGIAQCLRCQQLFKPNENNAMACRYHKKGREIREQYDNSGRLSKVLYKWACCKRGLDVQGCTYGYHI